jgi:hypothetical protein
VERKQNTPVINAKNLYAKIAQSRRRALLIRTISYLGPSITKNVSRKLLELVTSKLLNERERREVLSHSAPEDLTWHFAKREALLVKEPAPENKHH